MMQVIFWMVKVPRLWGMCARHVPADSKLRAGRSPFSRVSGKVKARKYCGRREEEEEEEEEERSMSTTANAGKKEGEKKM